MEPGDRAKVSETACPTRWESKRCISLSRSTPTARPRTRLRRSISAVSHRSRRARCRFSMPRMLYRPNSFLRRRMRKLLV